MPLPRPRALVLASLLVIAASGCATRVASTSSGAPEALQAGAEASFSGRITAIDTQPWTYDGNAVVQIDTATHGPVAVQLPARWNLCKAAPVDVESLRVGTRVDIAGSVTDDGAVVVCQRATHRLVPAR